MHSMNPSSALPHQQNPNTYFFFRPPSQNPNLNLSQPSGPLPPPQNPNPSHGQSSVPNLRLPPQSPNPSFGKSSLPNPLPPQYRNPSFGQSALTNLPPPPPQNPNPSFGQSSLPNLSSPPVRDLFAALSSLKSLISLSHQTLDSLSRTLSVDPHSIAQKSKDVNLIHCSYNQHHLLPPESLFLHSLRCPPPLDLTHLLPSFNYLHNLGPTCDFKVDRTGDDLCFHLDYPSSSRCNFCYEDCPGAVNISNLDGGTKMFTLPSVLSIECADFISNDCKEAKDVKENRFQILPSHLCALKNEIAEWRDFPSSYSFKVLSAVVGLKDVGETDMRKWVIANAPRYGVIIDTYMRDHIFVLFKLCSNSIVKEASSMVEFVVNTEDLEGNDQRVNLKNRRFECPVLVQVLMWLASQLAVLYGEGNGRLFAINMFKQCLFESASQILSFKSEDKMSETPEKAEVLKESNGASTDHQDTKPEQPLGRIAEGRSSKNMIDDNKMICVSQVAAAIAALHERSLLEQKIKEIRFAQSLTSYQRYVEHDMVTKKADEERKRRPNFRPIIDHDGFPRQQSSNQETNQTKTKEELLAEERDYKRRRMSYRGKKVKRTPLQVLRDIIEEFTEEIKLAGGIGSFEKPAEKDTAPKSDDSFPEVYERDPYGDHELSKDRRRSNGRDRYDEDSNSGSSRNRQSHGRSIRRDDDKRDLVDDDITRTREYSTKRRSSNHDSRSSYHMKGCDDDKRRRNKYDDRSSGLSRKKSFNDRYDPSER